MDITKHAREVVDIVELAASLDEKMTPLKVCDTWMGKGSSKIRKMAKVTTLSRLEVESVIVHLLLHGYFRYRSVSLIWRINLKWITSLQKFQNSSLVPVLSYSEDFSFTPFTTYFYLKAGRKAGLLKNETHSVMMKMRRKVSTPSSSVNIPPYSIYFPFPHIKYM